MELQYDCDDRVLSMTSGGVYTAYLYNGLGTRVATTQGVMKRLRRDGAGVTSSLLSDGDYSYNQGISRMSGSTVTSTHADMLGSLNLETNSSENVSATRSFNAFGNLTSSTGSPSGMLGYAGAWGYEEDASGLKLLGHRWYDSFSDRFLTRDPAKVGRNWYEYTDNDPLSGVDPSGLIPIGLIIHGGRRVTGFTRHGIDRLIGDTHKRAGTNERAILDALKNPKKVTVDPKDPSKTVFQGEDARVVVNTETGKVISVNPLNARGVRGFGAALEIVGTVSMFLDAWSYLKYPPGTRVKDQNGDYWDRYPDGSWRKAPWF